MKNNVYLASKPRYEILDGLRGVAALLVVGYHLLETYFHGGSNQPINHGYLAVDFFFVLSGFVTGYPTMTAGIVCLNGYTRMGQERKAMHVGQRTV